MGRKIFVILACCLAFTFASSARAELPVEQAVLTDAPNVPPPITRDHPAKVVVDLEVREVVKEINDGAQYTFWTFGGSVPGKFIRIRQGDQVEFHLANHPSSKLPHNIDLHAVTGPGGGAASSFTAPGHKSTFSFKALNPGLYVYHCATAPVGMHVANGMYGLIYVQPEKPLPPVDREYYVMQGDFYTVGAFGDKGPQAFSMQRAIEEHPTFVVFNGRVGALVGDKALAAKVGEKVRLYVGVGGPNITSSFHVIGEIFDNVYIEGGMTENHQVQTTLIPAGGSAIVEYTVNVPGTYVLVDHSLLRAFNKGALGMMKVEGEPNKEIYSGKEIDEAYLGDQASAGSAAEVSKLKGEYEKAVKESSELRKLTKGILMAQGKQIFASNCFMCHQSGGEGVPGVFPPLAKSDYIAGHSKGEGRSALIGLVVNGLAGKLTVNGTEYNGAMPALGQLTNEEIASVLTFISNSWGNSADAFSVEEVAQARADLEAKKAGSSK